MAEIFKLCLGHFLQLTQLQLPFVLMNLCSRFNSALMESHPHLVMVGGLEGEWSWDEQSLQPHMVWGQVMSPKKGSEEDRTKRQTPRLPISK